MPPRSAGLGSGDGFTSDSTELVAGTRRWGRDRVWTPPLLS
jgi:hypothetical protein